jgi:hypothetical protein
MFYNLLQSAATKFRALIHVRLRLYVQMYDNRYYVEDRIEKRQCENILYLSLYDHYKRIIGARHVKFLKEIYCTYALCGKHS